VVFLSLRRLALLFLIFLHGLLLFITYLLHGFLVLLGGFFGEAKVIFGARIFGSGGDGVSGTEGEKQQEKRNSFHDISGGKVLERFYTEERLRPGIDGVGCSGRNCPRLKLLLNLRDFAARLEAAPFQIAPLNRAAALGRWTRLPGFARLDGRGRRPHMS
jgi:hypothetical protein